MDVVSRLGWSAIIDYNIFPTPGPPAFQFATLIKLEIGSGDEATKHV